MYIQGYTSPWHLATLVSELCKVASIICESSKRPSLYVTLLASRSVMWHLEHWKCCAPLYIHIYIYI